MGLRGRFVLALVVVSALTLAAAVASLVPPLEHRLADDRLNALREQVRGVRPDIEELPARDLRPGARHARRLVRELARRTSGRVALVTPAGGVIADSDPDVRTALPALDEPPTGVRWRVQRGGAVLASGLDTHAGPLTLIID